MGRKFFIETYGCQMNDLDSEKIAGALFCSGMEPAVDATQADVIILNTCGIREKAVQKVYARLGAIKGSKTKNPELVIGVVGCMAQLEGENILKKAPFVNLLAGPQKGHAMAELVERASATNSPAIDMRMDEDPEPLETDHILRESPWRASVMISEGCSRRCSFCIVPLTRGRQRDRESGNIFNEVKGLVAGGHREIVLLGQTVNSYRDPVRKEVTFAGLLRRLAGVEGLKRIRFISPHPNDFTDELLEVMVSCPQVCNQIHLPVQSGSTKVLRAMRRGYTRARYMETIHKIRNASRPIAISTDIIVGFPGETEEDFQHTLSLLDEVQYDSVFSFKYSPRPNTESLRLANEVPEDEQGRRLKRLQEQQKLIQYNKNSAYMDQVMEVLVDDRARSRLALAGRTMNNKVVNLDGPESLIGRFVQVKITGFSANSLKGIWLSKGLEES